MQTQATSARPALSVVVVTLGGRPYVIRCLEALMRQTDADNVEIVVPCDDRISDVPSLQAQFPAVCFVRIEGWCTYAELRAIGVVQAQGEVVALTEDHCVPDPQWCVRIMEAHAASHAVIGGSVDKGRADTVLNWGVYLCDFSRYMSPVQEGPADYLTDCNVSYKAAALAPIRHLWERAFHETTVHWALRERGETLWLSPRIVVHQQRSLHFLTALRERHAFGRLFAATRVAAVSSGRRLIFAGLSWMLPLHLTARVALNVMRKRRHRRRFLKALPVVIGLNLVWACGEFVGYVTGRSAAVSKVQASGLYSVSGPVR
jgi:Glycosyl transferase family 2